MSGDAAWRRRTAACQAWADDASLAYGPLARHLVARAPFEAPGRPSARRRGRLRRGRGRAADAARDVLSADREFDMCDPRRARRRWRRTSPRCRSGTARSTWSVAAFVVNHLPDPVAGLTELRRVTRPGGAVLASTFSATSGRRPRARWTRWRRRRLRRRPGGTPTSRSARTPSGDPACGRAGACGGRVRPLERHRGAGRRRADRARRRGALPARGAAPPRASSCPCPSTHATAFVADAVEAVRRTGEPVRAGRRRSRRQSPSPAARQATVRNAGPCSAASRATCSARLAAVARACADPVASATSAASHQPSSAATPARASRSAVTSGLVDRLAEPCLRGRPDQPASTA